MADEPVIVLSEDESWSRLDDRLAGPTGYLYRR